MLVVKKRSNEGTMQKVGWISTGLLTVGLLAMGAMLVSSLPELRRYLKMETM